MADIVERLREEARFGWHLAANRQHATRELHSEAADLIARQREEIGRLSKLLEDERRSRDAKTV